MTKRAFAAAAALCAVAAVAAADVGGPAVNPAVTQRTIGRTICVSGWTKTVRPATSYTNRIKRQLLEAAGLPLSDAPLYELDHHLPIELGGAPRDPRNLRLQLWTGPEGARAKDVIETAMRRSVCAGRVELADAQACMWNHWQGCTP